MASMVNRMIGAAKLDAGTYEEVEADATATGQAMAVVVISAVAAGIGAARMGVMGVIGTTVAALVGWFIWAFLAWLVGTKMLPEPQTEADMGQLLRTIGFSASPGILRIFGFIPIIGGIIVFLAGIWMLVAMVIGVRQALDYTSTGRAVGVCVIGFIIYLVIMFVVMAAFGMMGAMTGALAGS